MKDGRHDNHELYYSEEDSRKLRSMLRRKERSLPTISHEQLKRKIEAVRKANDLQNISAKTDSSIPFVWIVTGLAAGAWLVYLAWRAM